MGTMQGFEIQPRSWALGSYVFTVPGNKYTQTRLHSRTCPKTNNKQNTAKFLNTSFSPSMGGRRGRRGRPVCGGGVRIRSPAPRGPYRAKNSIYPTTQKKCNLKGIEAGIHRRSSSSRHIANIARIDQRTRHATTQGALKRPKNSGAELASNTVI